MKGVLILSLLVLSCNCFDTYPHPAEREREVHMDMSFEGMVTMMKRGVSKALVGQYGGADMEHTGECAPEQEPDAWKMLGLTRASLTVDNPTATWTNFCFKNNKATFKWVDSMTAEIELESSERRSLTCTDTYLVSTVMHFDMKIIELGGKHKITYKFGSEEEVMVAQKTGLKIIKLCDHWYNLLPDFLLTFRTFLVDILQEKLVVKLPNSVYEKLYDNHYRFLHTWEGLKLERREQKHPVTVEWLELHAKSGDIFCRYQGGGSSTMIAWATGAQCSHIGVFMWGIKGNDKGKLFILQSNQMGIWKTPVKDFWADNFDTTINMMPLAPEWRAKFNLEKAWAWFETVDQQPYGIHNMFFTFLDTPENNWPQVLDSNMWFSFVIWMDTILPGVAETIMGQGLNHRLGTEGLTVSEIVVEATKRGITMGQLMSIPEQEGWKYNGQTQYVCCAFAAGLMYHSGMFGDMVILPQEFTNEDIYEWGIYDENYSLPPLCQANDPELPFCQLAGIYKMDPRNWNKVKPYSHMNEHCPSKAPFYRRPDGC